MKIYQTVSLIESNRLLEDFLIRHNLSCELWDDWEWTQGKSCLNIPNDPNFILIIDYDLLKQVDDLSRFADKIKNSRGLFYFSQEWDSMHVSRRSRNFDFFNSLLDCDRVFLHTEGLSDFPLGKILTTDYVNYFASCLDNLPMPSGQTRNKDFILTTILRKNRPHRKLLVDKLKEKNLLENYVGGIHNSLEQARDNWVGHTTQKPWADHQISWDLYDSAHFEIITETYAEHYTKLTEKTGKSIVYGLPFVICGDEKIYQHLHSLGFETFDGIIDESFAREPDLETRVSKLVDCVADIDPVDFYKSTREICEHNRNNLAVQRYESRRLQNKQLLEFFSPWILS